MSVKWAPLRAVVKIQWDETVHDTQWALSQSERLMIISSSRVLWHICGWVWKKGEGEGGWKSSSTELASSYKLILPRERRLFLALFCVFFTV